MTTQRFLLKLSLQHTWQLLRRDVAAWCVLGMAILFTLFALNQGQKVMANKQAQYAAAKIDQAKRYANLTEQLRSIESGKSTAPEQVWRNPQNAIFVGASRAAVAIQHPISPLGLVAVGATDIFPAVFTVGVNSKESYLFKDDVNNPLHLLTGAFDLAFVIVFLLPLWIIALGYNTVSSERESGTLKLLQVSTNHANFLLIIKLTIRALLPAIVCLMSMTVYFGFKGVFSSASVGQLSSLVAAIVAYTAFWIALTAWVNFSGQSSSQNILTLVSAWLVLGVILPGLISIAAQAMHPSPSNAELILTARSITNMVNSQQDEINEQRKLQQLTTADDEWTAGSSRERTLRRLATVQATSAAIDELLATQSKVLSRQHQLTERLSWVSPMILMNKTINQFSGNSLQQHQYFLKELALYHQKLQTFFTSYAASNRVLKSEDIAGIPLFK